MLLMKEKDGERMLPVMMSKRRALNLMIRSQINRTVPVPVSFSDDVQLIMSMFGVQIKRVVITYFKDAAFHCSIYAEREGEEHQLDDCWAADGLMIATAAAAPLFIEEQLLDAQYMHKTGEDTFALNIKVLTRRMLVEALQYAIDAEDYEVASRLRDEIAKRNPDE